MKDDYQKHTLNLRRGDWEKLAGYYPDVPTSIVVRKLISTFIDQIEVTGEASLNAAVEIKL